VRQHKRHRLRVFTLQKLAELRGIHLLERCQIAHLRIADAAYIAQKLLSALATERLRQQPLRKIRTSPQDVLLGLLETVELQQNLRLFFRSNIADARQLFCQSLYLALAQASK